MKPQSILATLATNPDYSIGSPLSLPELGAYLQRELATPFEVDRNARHALRDQLYCDGGEHYMKTVIDHVFVDEQVRTLRKRWVKHTRFNNALKRIVNELSTVYAEPAKRTVAGDASQAKYDKLLEAVQMDEQMLQLSRLLNLHRVMLVSLRVRTVPGESEVDGELEEREPVLELVSPADARVVLHPCDNKLPIGWVIRSEHRPARDLGNPNLPRWVLWTDVERVALREDFSVIGGTYEQHGLGVNPWVPFTLGPIAGGFWPGEEGEDLVAAHVMIWFQAILLAKESKSANKQSIIQGDGTTMARGQAADSEIPNELADGQSVTTVDMSMDLSMFRDTADHVLNQAGYNYGLSAAILQHQGVQSGEARKLMRIPLGEIRKHQQPPLRRAERRLAYVMSCVLRVDLPSMAFDPTGWRMDFGIESSTLEPSASFDLFVKERTAGTDNTLAYLMRKSPGMTEDEARAELKANTAVELQRNIDMRPLEQISGAAGIDVRGIPYGVPGNAPLPTPGDPAAVDGKPAPAAGPAQAPHLGAPPAPHAATPPHAAAPEASVGEDIQKQALNGAQVTALLEVVTGYNTGDITRTQAIKSIALAFQLTDAAAAALIGPENERPAAKPEPAPVAPAFGGKPPPDAPPAP